MASRRPRIRETELLAMPYLWFPVSIGTNAVGQMDQLYSYPDRLNSLNIPCGTFPHGFCSRSHNQPLRRSSLHHLFQSLIQSYDQIRSYLYRRRCTYVDGAFRKGTGILGATWIRQGDICTLAMALDECSKLWNNADNPNGKHRKRSSGKRQLDCCCHRCRHLSLGRI